MRLPLLSLLFLLALAAPAAADSIVYVKDANVWVARPDGSEARALTTDGTPQFPYASPSQADDGTVVAVRGTRFFKLDRQGRRLAVLGSLLTDKPGSIGAVGPFDARISPDGSKIAYWLGIMAGWYDYRTDKYYTNPQSSIVIQSATDGTPLGTTMFYEEPSWLADGQLVLFDSQNGGVPQVVSGPPGTNHNDLTDWFHDRDTFNEPHGWRPIGAGEVSRDGRRLALLRAGGTMGEGYEPRMRYNHIQLYGVNGLTSAPTPQCRLVESEGVELGPPSWSPGGDALAWATPAGIYTSPVGPNCEGLVDRLVVPGGAEPDWGPAHPGDPGAAAPPPPAQPQQPVVQAPAAIERVSVRRGRLVVTVKCACAPSAVVRKGKRVVGRGKGTQDGRVTIKLRKRVRGKVKLVVTAGDAKLTRTVKLR
jgi:Tol biopolymer transport system component